MKKFFRHKYWLLVLLQLFVPTFVPVFVAASEISVPPDHLLLSKHHKDADCNRWVLALDNDFLVPGGRDQDYTYGISASYTNKSVSDWWISQPLQFIDSIFGLDASSRHGLEVGLYGFTPEDISERDVQLSDRPYASLVYATARAERIYPASGRVLSSHLTIGLLGLDVVGQLQKELHSIIDSKAPQGWQHQISDGGELTARYSLARQSLLLSHRSGFELKQSHTMSVGYITEATWGLNIRIGRIFSAWHQFTPELASYAESSAQSPAQRAERFVWAGFAIKARAYNAFLQGQFRRSAVEYAWSDLNHMIAEAWLGYTHGFVNGIFISYGLRAHTSELKRGEGDRSVVWGGLRLSSNI